MKITGLREHLIHKLSQNLFNKLQNTSNISEHLLKGVINEALNLFFRQYPGTRITQEDINSVLLGTYLREIRKANKGLQRLKQRNERLKTKLDLIGEYILSENDAEEFNKWMKGKDQGK